MIKKRLIGSVLAATSLLLLAGCESTSGSNEDNNYLNVTMPFSVFSDSEVDVDKLVDDSILKPEGLSLAEDGIRYQSGQADLNGDGEPEIFVMFQGGLFCGSGGCTSYLLDADGDILNRMTVVKPPVLLAETSQNGWRDFIVWSNGAYRLMSHDSQSYPSNPSLQPVVERDIGERTAMGMVMASELYQQDGYGLQPQDAETFFTPDTQHTFTFRHHGDANVLYTALVDLHKGTVDVTSTPVAK